MATATPPSAPTRGEIDRAIRRRRRSREADRQGHRHRSDGGIVIEGRVALVRHGAIISESRGDTCDCAVSAPGRPAGPRPISQAESPEERAAASRRAKRRRTSSLTCSPIEFGRIAAQRTGDLPELRDASVSASSKSSGLRQRLHHRGQRVPIWPRRRRPRSRRGVRSTP